jgi:catechol 2,3-dioxygenase-like lactoylglutathione lyase family enzyme
MAHVNPNELAPVAPEFFVPDVAEAVRLYTEKLGFTLLRADYPTFAILALGNAVIMFASEAVYAGPRSELQRRGGGIDIRIMVPDADTVRERVRAAGLDVVHEIADRDYGLRDFIVRDPNGFRIRFASIPK